MAYASLTDLKKMIPEEVIEQLTDDEGVGRVNDARVAEAIAGADAEIDSYCGARYSVPLAAPIPDIIKKCSVDIAIYNLYSRTMEVVPEARSERYKNAMRQLEGVAKGVMSIGAAEEPEAASAGTLFASCSKTADDRVFTADTLENY